MEYKQSKTYANLKTAIAGESQARTKYPYVAARAARDGLSHLQKVFLETAEQEKKHAEIWLNQLRGMAAGDTLRNLEEAAESEHFEWSDLYVSFAQVAREEGYDDIARLFADVASVEREHEARFRTYFERMKTQTMFELPERTAWKCESCGFECTQECAPEVCPLCSGPQTGFARAEDSLLKNGSHRHI